MFGLIAAISFVPALGSCGGATAPAPQDFTSLSQLNAIWTLNGTFAFSCNGVDEHEAVTNARIHIFNGAFDERNVALPSAACGIGTIRVQGAIDLTGAISGNVITQGGSPTLSDTFSGTCTATSCSAQTANTQLLYPFTLSNTAENVYDGTLWQLAVHCSDGTAMSFASSSSPPSLDNGGTLQGAGTTCSTSVCTAAGSTADASTDTWTLSGTVAANGALSATLAQGAAGSLVFSGGASSSATSLSGTGTFGATISLTQCSNTSGSGLPACSNCVKTR